MSEYIFDVVNQTSKLDWAFAFQRTGAFPLDRSSLFSSLTDAEAYARGDKTDERGLGGSSYVGQPISIYDADSNTVSLYIIEADRSLKEVGSAPLGDNTSIEVVDGKVQLKDFDVSYYAYVPAVKDEETGEVTTPSTYALTEGFKEGLEPRVRLEGEDYVIAWYEPSGTTIEDISAILTSVQENVANLETAVDALEKSVGQAASAEEGTAATGLYAELDKKANIADVYTKTQTDEKIATEVAKADHLKRKIVDDIDDIDLTAEDASQYIYMVPTGLQADDDKYDEYIVIDGVIEKVGSWEVNLEPYATTEYVDDELAKKVDAVDGSRLMTDEEGTKLAGIEAGAQVNYIDNTTGEFAVNDGELSLVQVAQAKVIGLIDALNQLTESLANKVDIEEGSRLITANEITKLESIKDLIQSIDTEKFTIDENGKLLLNSIEINEVTGLVEKFAEKVDKVEGSRLITEQEAKKLEALNLDGEDITISGSVNASQVQELYDVVYRIVTGTGTEIFDEVSRQLLGIEIGAEKNIIDSVNEAQLSIDENRKLSIKAVDIAAVTGLQDILDGKASTQSVTNVVTLLNQKYEAHEARIASLEGRLTWQPLVDDVE